MIVRKVLPKTIAEPKDFKGTKFYVANSAESEAVQKAMFELGFCWTFHKKGEKREVFISKYANPGHWLYVDKDCRIYWDNNEIFDNDVLGKPKATFQSALFNAAIAHKAKKVAKRKAKRQSKGGWIATNWKQPEGYGVVKFRGGVVSKPMNFDNWIWDNAPGDFIIVAYRRETPPEPAVTHVVPFVDMIDDIIRGAQEILPAIPAGFIRHYPTADSVSPVDGDDVVDLCLRDGYISTGMLASVCNWGLTANPTNEIHGYRVYAKPRAEIVAPKAPLAPATAATPDTNPKKQFGDKSIPLNLWPALASSYGALGLYNGKLKYGQSNFNATPVEASIYIAGALRHLNAWAEGEEFDPADDVPNLGGVLANIAIILEARAAGTLIDDRKLGSGYLKEREALKEIVQKLNVRHADKAPRHYTLADAVV